MKPNPALGMVLKVRGGVNSESKQKPVIRHVFLYPTFEAGNVHYLYTVLFGGFLWLSLWQVVESDINCLRIWCGS